MNKDIKKKLLKQGRIKKKKLKEEITEELKGVNEVWEIEKEKEKTTVLIGIEYVKELLKDYNQLNKELKIIENN